MILDGGRLHHNLAIRLLNDLYGIQVRGGCMCAGTHIDLLGIGQEESEAIRCSLDEDVAAKPGGCGVFSPATSEGEFRVLLEAIPHIAREWRSTRRTTRWTSIPRSGTTKVTDSASKVWL